MPDPLRTRVRLLWVSYLLVWLSTQAFYGAVTPAAVALCLLALVALNGLAMVALPGGMKLSRVTVGFLGALGVTFLVQLLPTGGLLFPRTHEMRVVHEVGTYWPGTADTFLTVRALAQLTAYVLSALLILKLRAEGLSGTAMMKSLGAVLVLQAGYGVAQEFAGLKEIPFFGPRHLPTSASGTYVNANTFGGVMAMALVVAVGLAYSRFAWRGPGSRERRVESGVLWALAAALFAFALVLSRSRGGAIAAAAGVLAIPFLHRGRASLTGALLVLAVGAAGVAFASPAVRLSRFKELGNAELHENHRIKIWSTTLSAAAAQPVWGWGVGTHRYAYHPFQPATMVGQIDHAHNEYLNFFFEGGAVFLLTMVLGLGAWAWRSWSASQRLPAPERFLPTVAFAAVLAEAVHSVVDMDCRVTSAGMLLASLVALAAAPIRSDAKSRCSAWATTAILGGLSAMALLVLPLDAPRIMASVPPGDPRPAEQAIRRALGFSPFHNQAAWVRARWSEIHESAPAADRCYGVAADLWPAHPGLQRDVAAYFWNRWKATADKAHYQRAARSFHRLFVQDPGALAAVMADAWSPSRPMEEYEGLLPPGSAAARGAFAGFLIAAGELRRGMEAFERGVPPHPENAAIFDAFAHRLAGGSHWGAEALIRDRRLAFHSDPRAHAEAARAWARLEAWDRALERVRFACRAEPTRAEWEALRGDILKGKGDAEGALEAYMSAIRLAPLDLRYLERRAALYFEMRLPERAADDYRQLLRARPGDRSTTLCLARSLAVSRDVVGARRVLDDLLSRHPRDAEAEALRKSLDR
jgi:O-antigen ligase/tetratricopeptide (TPR) repeat protein